MDDKDVLDIQTVPFQIKKDRNVRSLFKDALDYLTHDGTLLFRALSVYSLSFILFASLAAYFFLNTNTQLENLYYLKDNLSKAEYIFLVFNTLLFIAGLCLMTFVVNLMLLLKDRIKTESHSQLFIEFKKEFALHIKNYAVNFIIVFVAYYLLRFVVMFLEGLELFTNDGGLDFAPYNGEMNMLFKIIMSALFMPLILYFAFSALFVSLRDNTGSADALQKVHEVTMPGIKKIWLISILMYFMGTVAIGLAGYLTGFSLGHLDSTGFLFFLALLTLKIITLGMFVLMNIGSVLLFGAAEQWSEESQNEPEEVEPTIN